ncbi:unnamed protein product [Ceratitis capitata]|uniref:(Mediterranean fruit fly) hypothetical protein n=1 Tax=Ceratitis capitata TaxID=7213 RepID=A0A811UJY5_CERCA|nr:unnamed protein product [Ceratitis capitata]
MSTPLRSDRAPRTELSSYEREKCKFAKTIETETAHVLTHSVLPLNFFASDCVLRTKVLAKSVKKASVSIEWPWLARARKMAKTVDTRRQSAKSSRGEWTCHLVFRRTTIEFDCLHNKKNLDK